MRVLATLLVIVALATSESPATARRDDVPPGHSDLLIHSPFVACSGGTQPTIDVPARLRIATWNIHAARSATVDAIAAEMHAMQADIIALQEVDVRTRRGGFVDAPGALAAALGFQYVFAASIKWDEGDYGLAVLSRWPLTNVQRHRLDSAPEAEPRIVLDVTVCARGRPLHVLNHHADRRVVSRALGFAGLKRIVRAAVGHGIVVLGDLNEYPDAPGVRSLIDTGLVDLGAERAVNTTRLGRVDYVLADRMLARLALPARVWPTDKSDHHAVLVDLKW